MAFPLTNWTLASVQCAQRPHPAIAIGIGLHRHHGLHGLQRVRLDRQTALLQKRVEVVGIDMCPPKLLIHEGFEYLIFCLSKMSKQLAAKKTHEVDTGAVMRNPKVCGVDLILFMKETDPSESDGACLDGRGARQNGLIVRVCVVCLFVGLRVCCLLQFRAVGLSVGLLFCCLPVCFCVSCGVCMLTLVESIGFLPDFTRKALSLTTT